MSVVTAVALVTSAAYFTTPPTAAVVLDVCSSGCAYTTIQGAINAAAPGDTILVGAGTYPENIGIGIDVSISGSGAGNTTIDGSGTNRVITVAAGATVTLADITVTNGYVSGSNNGGGINNEGTLHLERVLVTNNTADWGGGGIYNSGILTVTDSWVIGNIGQTIGTGIIGGAGIATLGSGSSLTVTRSTIADNRLVKPGTEDRGGGGISSKWSALTIIDSSFTNNESGYAAGGLWVQGGSFTLTRSTVASNRTGTDPARGYGSGGGMFLKSSVATITDSTISSNTAKTVGGGIYNKGNLTVTNSTISGNAAARGGGGIYSKNDLTLSSVTVASNSAASNSGAWGGGVYAFGNTITVDNTLIADNTVTTAGTDCYGTVNAPAGSVSLVESTDAIDCVSAGAGTIVTGVDPLLGPLQDNGGPTLTHELLAGSPALDTGSTALTADQRGEPRPVGSGDDIGAYERAVTVPPVGPPFALVPRSGGLGTDIGVQATVTGGQSCGWSPGETVEIWWDDPEARLATLTVDAAGCFSAMVLVDGAERIQGSKTGVHTVEARGSVSGTSQAQFEQTSEQLLLSPSEGPAEFAVAASGCGWDGLTSVNIYWSGTGELVGKAFVDNFSGCISATVTIPSAKNGIYALAASPGSFPGPNPQPGTTAAAYRVRQATITLTPAEGPPGGRIPLTGCTWFPGEQIEFSFGDSGVVFDTAGVGVGGCITTGGPTDPVLVLPVTAVLGQTTIRAIGADSGLTIDTPFAVLNPTLVLDPTRGLPGNTIGVSGCGWVGNDTVTIEWGYPDTNNLPIRWLATVDTDTGCFGEDGFTIDVPDNTITGRVRVDGTGSASGYTFVFFIVSHDGTINVSAPDGVAGSEILVEVSTAVVGETITFYVEGQPVDGVGAITPDFTYPLTIPTWAPIGNVQLHAVGTKGFNDWAVFNVTDDSAIDVVTAGPILGGDSIRVAGTNWRSGGQVTLTLERGSMSDATFKVVTIPETDRDFAVSFRLPDDLSGGIYTVRAVGDRGREATADFGVGEYTVALTINRVRVFGAGFDGLDTLGDMYPRVIVDAPGFPYFGAARRLAHTTDADVADPRWTFGFNVPIDAPATMPIEIRLFDWDEGADPATEQQADINPSSASEGVVLPLDLVTGTWPGAPLGQGCFQGDNADTRVEVCFTVSRVSTSGDIDADGFLDRWEIDGVDLNADGAADVDLGSLGASPCRATIAVDWDAMPSRTPLPDSMTAVVDAFDAAPIAAPPKCGVLGFAPEAGIDLILDRGTGVPWQEEIICSDLRAYRAANEDSARSRLFYYALFANRQEGSGSSGRACGDGAVMISLGNPWPDTEKRTRSESSTLMHELGHALGLKHGGGDNANRKPNYLSVMSYRFQLAGLFTADGTATVLDYSREKLRDLDESALTEARITTGNLRTAWTGPSWALGIGAANAPLDWNDDGATTDPYAQDLNDDSLCVASGKDNILQTKTEGDDVVNSARKSGVGDIINAGPDGVCDTAIDDTSDDKQKRDVGYKALGVLEGYDDWANLKLRAKINLRGSGLDLDTVHDTDDLTVEELEEEYRFWFGEAPRATVSPVSQSVQYSDEITAVAITVNDPDPGALNLEWSTLPTGMSVTLNSCESTSGGGVECVWILTGQMLESTGSYTITFTASDGVSDSVPATATIAVVDYDVSDVFTDDDGSVFEADIEWIAAAGITKGCNPPTNDRFCPNSDVTRGQMAAFLVRALGLTDRLDNPFVDDDGSVFETDIERLAAAGITKGCNPPANDQFCPTKRVTRGQMAAFLVRALAYSDDGGGDLFIDDDDNIFEADIDRLATAGVTKGCNPPANDQYCPNDFVRRDQMAAFLHRAFR